MRRTSFFLFIFSFFLSSSEAQAQRDAKIPDPDPELERKTFVVPDGFEVNLWAADPMLAKPLQMNFDPAGRLWVSSSEVYPQIKPGQVANDKVLVLEDTDGDGKADKTTVFADGLLIPTGLAPGDGGVYVADSTDLVHFSDPDPKTGKARKKRIVLSGFGTEDTHHILHTLRWGPDGCLYMNQSIYIHSHIETPHGVRRLNAGGIWRFRTDTVELDVFARGWYNPWGTAFDRFGTTFATDGANGEGINYVVPGAAYPSAKWDGQILHGLNPGSPKHCGLTILSGRHVPDDFRGDLVTNDFRGHRVCRFELKDDGSGFASREKQELIKSSHPAFRPIDVAMGPDGAIYVADWYNPIIQHGEVDFRDPRRDKTHGRIWRITAKKRDLVERPKLVGATVPELLERLKDPEDYTRLQAKRVLKDLGARAVLPGLAAWVEKLPEADEHARLEALWVYQTLDVPEPNLLEKVLSAKDSRVRAAACRIAGDWAPRMANMVRVNLDPNKLQALSVTATDVVRALQNNDRDLFLHKSDDLSIRFHRRGGAIAPKQLLDLVIQRKNDRDVTLGMVAAVEADPSGNAAAMLSSRVIDENPLVRLEAVRAIAKLPSAKSAEIAARALEKPVDRWLDYAIWLTLRELTPKWLPELRAGTIDFGGDPRKIVFALQASGSGDVVGPLTTLLKSGKLAKDREAEVWELIAKTGGSPEIGQALAKAAATGDPEGKILAAIESSVRTRKVGAPGNAADLAKLIAGPITPARTPAVRLIGLWKVEKLRSTAESAALAGDPAAFEAIPLLGGPASLSFLQKTADSETPAIRRQAIAALAGIDPKTAAEKAVSDLAKAEPSEETVAIFSAFTNRKGAGRDLALALRDRKLPADVAKIGVRVAKAAGQPDSVLIDALTKSGGLGEGRKMPAGKDLEAFLVDVAKLGDPARGERIYRRTDAACQKCHAIAGAGGLVGPDFTSIGASAQVDYLIESLLAPNAKIKEGYNSLVVNTIDGKVVTGIKLRETKTELVLRDAEDKEIVVPVADIDSRKDGRTLMPDGTTDPLTRQELVDLVRFLSELGKGKYAAAAGKVVRRWQVVQPTKELHTLANRDRIAAVANPKATLAWLPVYSRVSGDLPLEELPQFRPHKAGPTFSVVRFQLEVSVGGKVKLAIPDPNGLAIWVDGIPADLGKEVILDLQPGLRTVTIAVDVDTRKAPLRVELAELPDSPARAKLVGGK